MFNDPMILLYQDSTNFARLSLILKLMNLKIIIKISQNKYNY